MNDILDMAQKGIREFDAKKMRSEFSGTSYSGIQITSEDNVPSICANLPHGKLRVVKLDQLLGKRFKHGLLGIGLTGEQVSDWILERQGKTTAINGIEGVLDTFLIEPFVPHQQEFYLSFQTSREGDVISFSFQGGSEIEENRDQIDQIEIPVGEEFSREKFLKKIKLDHEKILSFISDMFAFFRQYGFVYLEVNPFVVDNAGKIVCLDMVAKVDACEERKQRSRWGSIEWVRAFGASTSPFEEEVEKIDAETGASVKFTTLNPFGSIGLVLGGGGASVLTIDTLAKQGYFNQIINYGELSGNPNYRHDKIYVQGLLDMMCENNHPRQWLCLIGGIANFTDIGVLAKAFVDVLEERVDDLLKHNIHLLVRRGGINEKIGLNLIQSFCEKRGIPCIVTDSNVYITDAINELSFS